MARTCRERCGCDRMCPVVSGKKSSAVDSIRQLNEVMVLLVAVYVLLEFRAIPYGCSAEQKGFCLDLYIRAGGADNPDHYYQSCTIERLACMEQLVRPELTFDEWRPQQASYDPVYTIDQQYCLCMVAILTPQVITRVGFLNVTTRDISLRSNPSAYCTPALGPWLILIFFVGALLVYVGECALPRRVSAMMLLIGSIFFYGITFAILAGLTSVCPGRVYRDTVTVLGFACLGCTVLALFGLAWMFLVSHKRLCCQKCVSFEDSDDDQQTNVPMTPVP